MAAYSARGEPLDRRNTAPATSPVNHQRRTWSSNGVHFAVETASYSTPGFSFHASAGRSHNPYEDFFTTQPGFVRTGRRQQRTVNGGLFGLLENLMTPPSIQVHRTYDQSNNSRQRATQFEEISSSEDYEEDEDDGLAYGPLPPPGPQQSRFSRLKSRFLENTQKSRPQQQRMDRASSPPPNTTHPRDDRRRRQRTPSGDTGANNAYMAEAIQRTIDHEWKQLKTSKRRLEQASRQPTVTASQLQGLLDDVKAHEQTLARATRDLQQARERIARNAAPPPHPSRYKASSSTSRVDSRPPTMPQDETFLHFGEDAFEEFRDFNDFNGTRGFNTFDPFRGFTFNMFDHGEAFDDLDDLAFLHDSAFGGSRPNKRTRTFPGQARARAGPQHSSRFSTYSAMPERPTQSLRAPSTLLTSSEAKQLYALYSERWNRLSHIDPDIPFPCRTLQSHALVARDALWAPMCTSSVSEWSDEGVMQANTQAFFLGAVGLTPKYSDVTGRVEMEFDTKHASRAQVAELVSILKKEKTRWHSDRLGRRNGGAALPNEALQSDEKARAVFHAVCELIQVAQDWISETGSA